MKLIRRLTFTLGLLWLVSGSIKTVYANEGPRILVIHQIRGDEPCCEAGNPEMVRIINSDMQLSDLPLAWALRYDILINEDLLENYTNLPKQQTLGVLLEVTPKLASASGVNYKGDPAGVDWQNARHAFLIGYTQAERKELIDTVFQAFYDRFRYYPPFTVSWMIDSWSLNYLRETYGVRVHELTKEQYETDGYTLYGGIFNLPYWPHRYHPFVPARNLSEQLDLLVVRQTISDIEKNYGSYQSFYTSQPNDYLANPDQTDFTYFTSLFDQMMAQEKENQFAVIGLENSQEWQTYHEEYLKQLRFLAEKQESGSLRLTTPFEYYTLHRNKFPINPVRILRSSTFPEKGVLWYFGQDYRVRLEVGKEGLILTDLRNFTQLADPYQHEPAAYSQAYWIAPYLVDSSQMYVESYDDQENDLYRHHPVRSDNGVARFGIVLVQNQIKKVNQVSDGIVSLSSDTVTVKLTPNAIEIEGLTSPLFLPPVQMTTSQVLEAGVDHYITFARHPRFFLKSDRDKRRVDMGWENRQLEQVTIATIYQTEKGWNLQPNEGVTSTQLESLSVIFQPDKSLLPFDPQTSTIFWHNLEAIAGKSPVRLFIDPRNSLDKPVSVKSMTASVDPNIGIELVTPHTFTSKMEPFFIDFTSSHKSQDRVRVTIDGNIIPIQPIIRFYPNCRQLLSECVKNREELIGYAKIVWREKRQRYQNRLEDKLQEMNRGMQTVFKPIKSLLPKKVLW